MKDREEFEGKTPEKKSRKKLVIGILAAVCIVAVVYLFPVFWFQSHFLPHSEVNGADCGGMNVAEARQLLEQNAKTYELKLKESDGTEETVVGSDIDLKATCDDQSLSQLMKKQNTFVWFLSLNRESKLAVQQAAVFDEQKLDQIVKQLKCSDESRMTDSVNASLSEYDPEKGFELVEAQYGTRLLPEQFEENLTAALSKMDSELDLAASGCYEEPEYSADSEEAQQMLAKANAYTKPVISYEFGDASEVLDGKTISQWLKVKNMKVSLDTSKVEKYVKSLAEKYNTVDRAKSLKTHSGTVVKVSGGNYGWKIDEEQTVSELKKLLSSGKDYTGEVKFSRTAYSLDGGDFGDTYVEINLTAQHLWFYKKGKLVIDSDFVSGCTGKGHGTPTGAYSLAYKTRNAVLRGPDYESPVSYWMPFNGDVGMHDSSWRGVYGGSIYKSNGSHGCVNLPYNTAKTIYSNIEKGVPVVVYTLAGTESSSTSRAWGGTGGSGTVSKKKTSSSTKKTESDKKKKNEKKKDTSKDKNNTTNKDKDKDTENTPTQPSQPAQPEQPSEQPKPSEPAQPSEPSTSGGSEDSGDQQSSGQSSQS